MPVKPIFIAGRRIGPEDPPYIIAELSANHGGDIERAKRIIRLAARAGADSIKFQVYTPDNMTLASDMPGFTIEADTPWKGRRLHDLYGEAQTPYDWFPELFRVAKEANITPFASVFGLDAIEAMERLDAPAYKIASFEAVDLELIKATAKTGKPLIISTGLCTEEEAAAALDAARAGGATQVSLLKCNSSYPSDPTEANLLAMVAMQEKYGIPCGYSDHTMGAVTSITACALGATVIEKHIIDAREPPTADSTFSALPEEFAELVKGCRMAFASRGSTKLGPTPREKPSLAFRRSIYASQDIPAGAAFTRDNVTVVRPGHGLAPSQLGNVLTRKATRAIKRGEPIANDMLG
jgi:N-acetylneuraminate synthase